MPVKTRFRLMPRAPAISLLSMPARTTAPILVFSCSSHNSTAINEAEAYDEELDVRDTHAPDDREPSNQLGSSWPLGNPPQMFRIAPTMM